MSIPNRLSKLRSAMRDNGLPALLIMSGFNRKYMTGFTGSAGYVLVTEDEAILFTDFRYMTQAPQQAKHFTVVEHEQVRPLGTVKSTLKNLGIAELGFEQNHVSYASYQSLVQELEGIRIVAAPPLVEALRMVKDEEEIEVMQEAADLADATFSHVLQYLKPGASERDIALEIEFYMRKRGAVSSSFDTIVASGERSALPHGVASDKKIGAGELVTLDFGALYKGYCSDITRTVYVGGNGAPDPKAKEIYDIVLEAQMAVLAALKPGMTGKEGDTIARDIIARYGYAEYFGHGTGHGLGMEVHESPRLNKTGDVVLQPGMVVTVEPGIYLPGFGGVRIEDDVVMTEGGIRILTRSSKQFTVLE
ncbi:M24 family metallopeptidase [Paenibacillus turpanensis]|uniref:M24 family metallopeptidase n=1 Tax=Paenibacillus turpanensis TaxID=2689078 RepID=UPI001408D9AF|nr:Xaa-Pro peptidase family protein [Paenibacillus turpanensis]